MINITIPAAARIRIIYFSTSKKDARKIPAKNARDKIKNILDLVTSLIILKKAG
jgi:hypothetical protein